MAAAQRAGGRVPKRLRQLESVAGRGLLLGCGTKQQAPAAHYVVLAARCPSAAAAEDGAAGSSSSGGEEWRVIYRSEALGGTANPEWRPLAWGEQQLLQHDPLLDGSSAQLLLALHALEPAGAAGVAGGGPAAGRAAGAAAAAAAAAEAGAAADGQQAAGGLDHPLMFAATERPAFRLPAPLLPPHGSSSEPASMSVSISAEAQEPAPPEAFDGQQAAAVVGAAGGQLPPAATASGSGQQQQQEVQQEQQQAQQPHPAEGSQQQQNGLHAGAQPEATQQQAAEASGGPAAQEGQQQQRQQPASNSQASTPAAAEATEAASAEASTADADADAAAEAPAPPRADDWVPAAAAALAGTGTCPGRLVAAWRLGSLSELFPAGPDLAGVRQPLQPDTLVLSFGSAGLCLCPPPLQQEEAGSTTAPPSLQASPLKRSQLPSATATAGEERGEGAGPGPGRRFASLLVSKLLRSTANLQEAGSLGSHADLAAELAGASSDAESDDAGSDVTSTTAATRRTTATAPSELPGTAVAGGPAAAGSVPGSSGRSGNARTAAAGAAGAAAAGGSSGATKALTLASAHQCVSSLVALQSRLRDLAGRSQALQQQLGQRLEPQRQRRQQDAALAALAEEAARCRRQAAEVEQQVAGVQAAAAAAKKQATVRAQALVTVLKVMAAADRRVSEAEAALRGEEGRGALMAVLRELVARRCQMVCQLGAIFRLGPTAVSIPQAPPGGFLEDRLERQWAGATTSEGSMSGGSGGDGMLSLAAAAGAGRYGSSSFGLDGFGSGAEGPSKYRQEMRLSIGGLEVRPSVWRKAFDDGGYESDAAEDRAAGVALGYVAQMVDRLAAYLDVPLRYPLALRGSRSAVIDSYPPAGTWADAEEEGGAKRTLFGRGGGAAAAAAAAQRVEYPLYCDSNRERPRFAVAVFLLNKDVIQLLQAHGISAAGPNHLLHNLHKLLLAAQSGLPTPRALPAA